MGWSSLSIVEPGRPLALAPDAVAVPALSSTVRPSLVLREAQARALLDAAARADVSRGGTFSSGPTGVRLWSGPFDGTDGGPGSALMLGGVDWTYDTPNRHWVMIHRAMVTAEGLAAGESTTSVLGRVMALCGLSMDGEVLSVPKAPPRDPFHRPLPAAAVGYGLQTPHG